MVATLEEMTLTLHGKKLLNYNKNYLYLMLLLFINNLLKYPPINSNYAISIGQLPRLIEF